MSSQLADAIRDLPDAALVPVGWVREHLQEAPAPAQEAVEVDLDLRAASALYGRSVSTLRSWCQEGRLPGAYRLRGREWRIPRESLARFQEAQRRTASPENRKPSPRGDGDLSAWRRTV
jgi:excisionase family DNA binding protein